MLVAAAARDKPQVRLAALEVVVMATEQQVVLGLLDKAIMVALVLGLLTI
jgi:hypothetical protein